jgi:hypothetical protein
MTTMAKIAIRSSQVGKIGKEVRDRRFSKNRLREPIQHITIAAANYLVRGENWMNGIRFLSSGAHDSPPSGKRHDRNDELATSVAVGSTPIGLAPPH